MSTLVVNTVKAQSGTGAPVFQNSSGTEKGQLCKAWCNLNGTDTAQAKYQFNFTTAFGNTNYCVLTGQARKADGDGDDRFFSKSYNYNTTDFRVEHAFAANDSQNSDSEYVFIAVMAS